MQFASPQLFVPTTPTEIQNYFVQDINERQNTNIGFITFNFLKENFKDSLFSAKEPFICQKCGAAINLYSNIRESEGLNSKYLWPCEFCGHQNIVHEFDENEKPITNNNVYLLKKYDKKKANMTEHQENEKIDYGEKETPIIFCIDVSGSMLKEVDGISRIKSVYRAIKTCLLDLKENFPKRKVGIVLFSNKIKVLGDCWEEPLIFYSDLEFKNYITKGQQCFDAVLNHSVDHSYEKILKRIKQIEVNGCTSLGPALAVSIGMLSRTSNGGCLIICTDGCANKGLGSLAYMANEKISREFYDEVAHYANEHSISINITTIIGDSECRIDVLADLTDNTNGIINRVSPLDLKKEFQNVIKQEFLAQKVEIKLFLHEALTLKSSSEKEFQNIQGKYYKKILGNIHENTEVMFEYDLRETNNQNLKYYNTFLRRFPLQVQINFSTLEGNFLKIMTIMQEISNEKEEVEKKASVAAIKKIALRKASAMIINEKKIFDHSTYYSIAEKSANNSGKLEDKHLLEQFKSKIKRIEELIEKASNVPTIDSNYSPESRGEKPELMKQTFKKQIIINNNQHYVETFSPIKETHSAFHFGVIPKKKHINCEMTDDIVIKLMKIKNSQTDLI